ncbi:GspH/FimT family pseudopilin [Luteimonas terrae]|uniref:Type II secretion system protein H n=1 Tax=Luteimonas terrae TaxID=1530191 RepID=A0ABU1Y041_9GAMM|nr:GspH/FimT family pseudopilin [Luteimonas terrae]MDR7194394.1 general secretion pathway protein H [Luteimonas terrae]
MPRAQAGFTLIELLVVMVVIGLATTAVALTLPDGNAGFHRQADQFGLHLKHARDEAILGGRAMQVSVDAGGYRFSRRDFGQWQRLEEAPFTARHWADGVTVVLPQRLEQLNFRFDATGAAEPQHLQLARDGMYAEIVVDAAGTVCVQ